MDPLSVALGIAGILPLIAKAIKVAKEYKDGVDGAKTSIVALVKELEALQLNAVGLNEFLQSTKVVSDGLSFQHTSVLFSCSTNCEVKLRVLLEKLERKAESKWSRLQWPFSEKESQKMAQEIRNFATWMHFALSLDGCRLLSHTSEDVTKVLGQQLEQFRVIQSVQETTSRIFDVVHVGQVRGARKEILDWVSTASFYQKHQSLQETRTGNTGNWILHNPAYLGWRDKTSEANILCCHGIKGSGKTTLTSIMIDDTKTFGAPHPVAFFYFDYQEKSTQTSMTVVRCILRQLLDQGPTVPENVSAVYAASGSSRPPQQAEFERLILDVVKEAGRAYVIFDALDECAAEHRITIIRTLSRLGHIPGLQLLVTSREPAPELVDTFPNTLEVKVTAQRHDISLYIREELEKNGVYDMDGGGEFADTVVEKLTASAAGMFLLPVLQLRTILKENTSIGSMEDCLVKLSHTLAEAFEETISRMEALPASRRRIGFETLLYLTHAVRPLTVEELQDALAIQAGQTRVSVKHRPSVKMILDCCQGLATVDPVDRDLRVAHHSISEYVLANSKALFCEAHATLAIKCLTYCMSEDFNTGPWNSEHEIQQRIDNYHFLAYASKNWGIHAKRAGVSREVKIVLDNFFLSARAPAMTNQVRQYAMGRREEWWCAEESLSFMPLHFASRHGLLETVKELLQKRPDDINITTEYGTTPIIVAASGGHIDTVKALMERGADPHLCNEYGNALHCAMEANYPAAVRELVVKWGMDPKNPAGHRRTYLGCAVDRDAVKAFEELVKLGVDVQTTTLWTQTSGGHRAKEKGLHIFHQACGWNSVKIVQLMLDRGWVDVNLRSLRGRTGLHCAANKESLEVVEVLVKAGADVNAKDNDGFTALDLARRSYPWSPCFSGLQSSDICKKTPGSEHGTSITTMEGPID